MRKPAIPILALSLIIAACGDRRSNREIAEEAIVKFHALYNEGSFELICLQADAEFKSDQKGAIGYLRLVQETMGKVRESAEGTSNVQNLKDEAQITMVQLTEFDEGKTAETFVYRVKDREARLIFYEVKGPGLTKD